ncbi:MAG: phosphate signaling complex protein PhoU [Rhodospirillales bacterium]|nr:phosphate signaling complex protein PhoU [Acetobacter sp.]
MRTRFHQALDGLKERLLVMAGLVEQAIQRATSAYSERDTALCDLVLMAEPAINRMEREIDQLALDLLAMEQPMAVDLRFIMAVIRINADLERVGDQAVNIANRVKELGTLNASDLPVDIPRLAQLASAMVRKALQSFIEADAEMAQNVLTLDDQVDDMNRSAYSSLGKYIQEHPECASQALNALVISRNLERVGDHATNIAEDVIFWVKGDDVRHGGPNNLAEITSGAR